MYALGTRAKVIRSALTRTRSDCDNSLVVMKASSIFTIACKLHHESCFAPNAVCRNIDRSSSGRRGGDVSVREDAPAGEPRILCPGRASWFVDCGGLNPIQDLSRFFHCFPYNPLCVPGRTDLELKAAEMVTRPSWYGAALFQIESTTSDLPRPAVANRCTVGASQSAFDDLPASPTVGP